MEALREEKLTIGKEVLHFTEHLAQELSIDLRGAVELTAGEVGKEGIFLSETHVFFEQELFYVFLDALRGETLGSSRAVEGSDGCDILRAQEHETEDLGNDLEELRWGNGGLGACLP